MQLLSGRQQVANAVGARSSGVPALSGAPCCIHKGLTQQTGTASTPSVATRSASGLHQPVRRRPATAWQAAVHSADLATFADEAWKEAVQSAVEHNQDQLIELCMRGKVNKALQWRQVLVRPVDLKAGRHLQFSYFDERQNFVKNAPIGSADAHSRLQELLYTLPFTSVNLKTTQLDVNVQITKSGKAIITRSNAGAAARGPIRLTHDRVKDLPIPTDVPHPFLQRIGMQTAEGKLKASMSDKMAQVNEFLKLLKHTGVIEVLQAAQAAAEAPGRARRVRILDCGCGSAYLTFGVWHYLNNVLGVPAQLVGVDSNEGLMKKSNAYCQQLGLSPDEAVFITSSISNYQPTERPDVVLALHACDIATDQALSLGVKQGAAIIMAVPCCHQNLHKQLAGAKGLTVTPLQPLMRQGITKQRTLDLVTDTLRAQILRIAGYKTDVAEFVSTEHTPRNILIRAVRTKQDGALEQGDVGASVGQLVREYLAFKAFWGGVTPHLETLLEQELQPLLQSKVQ